MSDVGDELWDHDDYPPGFGENHDDPDPEMCDHDEHEIDVVTGRASCWSCGHSWWPTAEEIAAEIERIRAYDEWQREQERPWYRFKEWVSGARRELQGRWRRLWRREPAELDDAIPF